MSLSTPIRGVKTVLNANKRFKYRDPEGLVDFLVVGGGVVGLAIAQRLSHQFPDKSTYLIERHGSVGQETSSRNSEVIHAGLYYPPTSAKTAHCLRGRHLLYAHCKSHSIPYKKTGKLIVARQGQEEYIQNLHKKAQGLRFSNFTSNSNSNTGAEPTSMAAPTRLISGDEARAMEPSLSPEITAALYSPETGIIDSHALMSSLEQEITESECGSVVYSTELVRIDPSPKGGDGWVVQMLTRDSEEGGGTLTGQEEQRPDCVLARTVVNAGGLSAPTILNSILPEEKRYTAYFARGSYASYSGTLDPPIQRLIYPCHEVGKSHGFQSLGTHLTLDMQGRIKFGPDLEWISPPEGEDAEDPDFWNKHLIPSDARLEQMYRDVTSYLPGVRLDKMSPDYVGIRPKIGPPESGFYDFTFRTDVPIPNTAGGRGGKMISLLGIESPGLTSSLSIAEHVVRNMI